MVNASISAYIQLTNRLDEDLKQKEIEMQERLAEKDATIESKTAQITRLELTIADKDTIIKDKEARIVAVINPPPHLIPPPPPPQKYVTAEKREQN